MDARRRIDAPGGLPEILPIAVFWFFIGMLVCMHLLLFPEPDGSKVSLGLNLFWMAALGGGCGLLLVCARAVKSRRLRYLLLFSVLLAGVCLAWFRLGRPTVGVDDANIFLVYARNLRNGYGLVYNIGGERVEGFSSPLWVLVLAAFYVFTGTPELWLLGLNVLLLLIATGAVLAYLDGGEDSPGRGVLPAVGYVALIFIFPDYLVWMTLPLMETGLWSLLLVLASILLLRIRSASEKRALGGVSALLAALILARPEASAWSLVFLALLIFRIARLEGARRAAVAAAGPLAAFLSALSALTVFRMAYFGYPLPNTFYAKVSPSISYNLYTGYFYYLVPYLKSSPLVFFAVVVSLLLLFVNLLLLANRDADPETALRKTPLIDSLTLTLIVLAGLVIPVLSGGDHFRSFRFYQPVFPLLLLNLLIGLPILRKAAGRRFALSAQWGPVLLTIACPLVFLTNRVSWITLDQVGVSIVHEFRIAEDGRKTGNNLNGMFSGLESRPSLGVIMSGGIRYTYVGEVVDLMGLNNLKMGHSPGARQGIKNHAAFRKEVFYQLQPDFVVIDCGSNDGGDYLDHIGADAEFLRLYRCVRLRPEGGEGSVEGYLRNAWRTSLEGRPGITLEILSEP